MTCILPTFRAICARTPYRPKGIFYSEAFLFLKECDRRFVKQIIESGVKHGCSTALLAAAFEGPMISIDQTFSTRFAASAGVRLVRGDACVELPRLLSARTGQRVGVLIDGPKGAKALALKDVCLTFPCVQVVGIHDLPRGRGETRHSHDWTFRDYYGRELDALMPAAMMTKYPYGPGLGIWERL